MKNAHISQLFWSIVLGISVMANITNAPLWRAPIITSNNWLWTRLSNSKSLTSGQSDYRGLALCTGGNKFIGGRSLSRGESSALPLLILPRAWSPALWGGGAPQGRREGLFSLVAWICAGRLQGRALISTNRFLILGLHPRTHTHTHIYKSHIDTTCLCPPSWTRDNLLSLILRIGLDHKLRNHLLMETTLT